MQLSQGETSSQAAERYEVPMLGCSGGKSVNWQQLQQQAHKTCLPESGFPETPTSCPLMDVPFRESMIFIKTPVFVVPPWWGDKHGTEAEVYVGNWKNCGTFLPTYPCQHSAGSTIPAACPAQGVVAVTSLGELQQGASIQWINTNVSSTQAALRVPPSAQWAKPLPTLGALLLQVHQSILTGKN